jgi:hypothetical protein
VRVNGPRTVANGVPTSPQNYWQNHRCVLQPNRRAVVGGIDEKARQQPSRTNATRAAACLTPKHSVYVTQRIHGRWDASLGWSCNRLKARRRASARPGRLSHKPASRSNSGSHSQAFGRSINIPGCRRTAVLTLAIIKDMFWATCISISVVSAVNVLLWVWGAL